MVFARFSVGEGDRKFLQTRHLFRGNPTRVLNVRIESKKSETEDEDAEETMQRIP